MLETPMADLRVKVVKMGYSGKRCPKTGEMRNEYSLRDPLGNLPDTWDITCTERELQRFLRSMVPPAPTYAAARPSPTQMYSSSYTPPGQQYYVRNYTPEVVGPGWSCRQNAEQLLRTLHVPAALANIGGHLTDAILTRQMHKEHVTNGAEMREAFQNVFNWHK